MNFWTLPVDLRQPRDRTVVTGVGLLPTQRRMADARGEASGDERFAHATVLSKSSH